MNIDEATGLAGHRERTLSVLSNHGHVLLCIVADPNCRLRDIATRCNITERAVFGIVVCLETDGVIQRVKNGRRNHYLVNVDQPNISDVAYVPSIGALLQAMALPPVRVNAGV
ncbi:MAG TPA: hypothetical protein VGM78_05735 [Ilumatobacteraceae bacterium]